MRLAIMQPYLFPYIGYFQLMNAVDEFVIYDNIQFTKKGWINRNRILVNGKDDYISLPLKKDSDYLNVDERFLADAWVSEKKKMLNKIRSTYQKSPNFNVIFSLIEKIILFEENNLFSFLLNSIKLINEYLGIQTLITVSSTINIDHTLKSEKKVIEICKAKRTKVYINPVGGVDLYDTNIFKDQGIDLFFLKTNSITYPQFNHEFVPWLSIIDVLMFNPKEEIKEMLNSYTFLQL